MYDLDGEDDDTVDITPDFMKHEDPEVDVDAVNAGGTEDPVASEPVESGADSDSTDGIDDGDEKE
jgi:hypothetical protein